MIRTANPTLNTKIFENYPLATDAKMTIQGTVNRTGFLVFLAFVSALFVWNQFFKEPLSASVGGYIIVGTVGGLIVALITIFKKQWSSVTAPVYAILEGLVLGGISAFFELRFPGIVIQAIALTFGVLFSLLLVYKSRLIPVTQNFRLGVLAATGGVALIYFVSFILGFFGIHIPLIHEGGVFGIGFSLVVIVIAALNLVLDFDFIEKASEQGAPKYMEWYAAFGLIVTLVWLYLEILRLLSKLRSR